MRRWFWGWAVLAGASVVANACGGDGSDGAGPGAVDGGVDGSESSPSGDGSPPGTPDGQVGPTTSGGPLDPVAAGRAAVFIATCISDDGVNRTLQELYMERSTTLFGGGTDFVSCLASKSNGCRAITECMGYAYSRDGQCDAGCVGSVLHQCSSGGSVHLSTDCATGGSQCAPGPKPVCLPPGATACEASTFPSSCDDGVPVACVEGVTGRGLRCADYGATCTTIYTVSGGNPVMGCKGAGGTCTGASSDEPTTLSFEGARCDGNKLIGCLSSGLGTLDCSTSGVGFTCFESPDGGAGAQAYCGRAAECAPRSPWEKVRATCDGTSIVACNAGKLETIDCVALGFTGCTSGVCTPGFF